MEEIKSLVLSLVSQVESVLNRGFDNVYIMTSLKVFLGLYAAFAAPQLPPTLVNLMDNILVRIAFAFTIVLLATRDPSLALLVAVAFVVTLQTANKMRLINTSLSVADQGESSWLPSAKNQVEEPANQLQTVESVQKQVLPAQEPVLTAQEPVLTTQQPVLPYHANGYEEDKLIMSASQPSENFTNPPEEPSAHESADLTQNAFTTSAQMVSAQDNTVPGSNQESCVQTFANQNCAQGLQSNAPDGY